MDDWPVLHHRSALSQYPGRFHPEEFPQRLDFLLPRQLHSLAHVEENTESLRLPSQFFDFGMMRFDITPVILLSP